MSPRTLLAAITATTLTLAACQSVRTQDASPPAMEPPASPASRPAAAPSPAASPTATPRSAQHSYSEVPGVGRTIAITFDDGPSPKLTPELLDLLKQRGIKATFFVVGQNAAEYPDILRRAVAEGHEIGNHSWSHPALNRLSVAGVGAQIEKTNAAIKAAIGKDPVVMRPPYGATNSALNRRFHDQYGLKVIMWDVDPLDWKYRNAARVQRSILEGVKPGSIILVHDIHPTSVAAMPGTLDALIARGYKFATVSELIAMPTAATATPPAPAAPPATPGTVITAPPPVDPPASPTPALAPSPTP